MNAIFKKAVKRMFLITGPYHFYLFPASFLTARCVILSTSTSLIAVLKTGINGVSVKGLSAESMLISMTEKWKQALGNGSCVGAVFIDFQKTFDTVSHPILSHKLQAIGIFDLGMCMSGLYAISPIDLSLLLLMAANPPLAIFGLYDLPNCVGDTGDVYLYADDTTLSVTGESIDEVFAALNTMVENVLQWSMNNQLTIHPIKTEAMLIGNSPFIGPLPPLRFGSGFIRLVESSTCLGEKLDKRFFMV